LYRIYYGLIFRKEGIKIQGILIGSDGKGCAEDIDT